MIRLFRVSLPANILALLIAEAVLVMFCFTAPLYYALDVSPRIYLFEDGGVWRILLVEAVILLGLYFHDLYDDFRIRSHILLAQSICMSLGIAFVLQALMSYGRWDLVLPKWTMLLGSALLLPLLIAWRILFSASTLETLGADRILFLGQTPAAMEIMTHLARRPELGLMTVGYLNEEPTHAPAANPTSTPTPVIDSSLDLAPDLPLAGWLGPLSNLDEVVQRHRPDRLIVAMNERRGRLPMERLLALRNSGIRVEETARTYEYVLHRVSSRDLRLSHLIFSSDFGPRPHWIAMQSLYSWIFAAVLAVLLLPVMLVTALLVRLTSPGPVLYRQTRTGLNGGPFELYKFRSMRQDAEARTGAVWSAKDDPRITPLGRWLRRLRIDELPQLFNVLRGEMALVGPRPERPEFVRLLVEQIPYYSQRHCVKPGITGWAQINHKYGDTIEDAIVKLEYDLYYIKNLATSLDLYILFHTVKTMLLGRGAQ